MKASTQRSAGRLSRFFDEDRPMSRAARRALFVTAGALVVLGLAAFAVILASVLNRNGLAMLDEPIRAWMVEIRRPGLDTAMFILSLITGPVVLPLFMLVLTVAWIWLGKHAWRPVLLAGGMSLGVGIAIIIRDTVDRPRPPLDLMILFAPDQTFSFISGHTLGASNFALIGFYLLYSRLKNPRPWQLAVGLLLAAAWIGSSAASRLYLGFHWFTDLAGSLALAFVILGLVIALDTVRTARVLTISD